MPRRRIKKALVSFLSLVPRGANGLGVLLKDDGSFELSLLVKESSTFKDSGELLAVVYSPERRDRHGDIASAEVIRDAAHEFLRKGGSIDIRHDGNAVGKDRAFVAESFTIAKGDERFVGWKDYDGNPVDVSGGWGAVIKILDPDLKRAYSSGAWNGVSMGGTGLYEIEKESPDGDRIAETVAAVLKSLGVSPKPDNKPMDATQLAELKKSISDGNSSLSETLKAAFGELTKSLAEAIKPKAPETKPDEKPLKKEEVAPIFKGDPTNSEDLKAHMRRVALFQLRKSCDLSTVEGTMDYIQKLEEFTAQFGPITKQETGPAGAPAPSNASSTGGKSGGGKSGSEPSHALSGFGGLSKEDRSAADEGAALADFMNKARGI